MCLLIALLMQHWEVNIHVSTCLEGDINLGKYRQKVYCLRKQHTMSCIMIK